MHLVEEKLQIPLSQRSQFFDNNCENRCSITKIEVSPWWGTWFRFSLFTLLLRIARKYKKDYSSKKTMMECVGKKVAIRLFLNGYTNVTLEGHDDKGSSLSYYQGWVWLFGRKSRKKCLQHLSKPEPVKVIARKKKAMKALGTASRKPKRKLARKLVVDLRAVHSA